MCIKNIIKVIYDLIVEEYIGTSLKSLRLRKLLDQSDFSYWALLGPSGSLRVLLGHSGSFWALVSLTGPYWALLGLTGPYWALLGLTGLY